MKSHDSPKYRLILKGNTAAFYIELVMLSMALQLIVRHFHLLARRATLLQSERPRLSMALLDDLRV
jgi:hypothetical protein